MNRQSFSGMLVLSAILLCSSFCVGAEWLELGPAPLIIGPYTGRVSAVVASPTDPNRYFVGGASGGVWRTVDGGETWQPLTDHLPASAIGALVLDPTDENTIYAGTGEANFANHCFYGLGIYKSEDGGDTWTMLAEDTFGGRTFSRLVVSYDNPSVLYASIMHAGGFPAKNAAKGHPGTDGPVGVFRSTDGGVSWTHLTNGLPASQASDVWMDPATPSTLYAAIGDIFGLPENGIYKSVDGGDSWVRLTNGLPAETMGRITLAVAPSDPNRIYAIITNPNDETGGGASTMDVYRSDNGGDRWWATHSGNFQATYGWFLSTAIVNPTDPNTLFVGGLSLLRSTSAGGTYSFVTPPHVDMHGLAYDAAGRLLSSNDGGLHRSEDNGESWDALNWDLGVVQFYPGLSVHPTDPDYIIGGTQDNGTNRKVSEFKIWHNKLGGDGGCTSMGVGAVTTVFAENQGTGNLYRAVNTASFTLKNTGIVGSDRNCFLPPVTHDPSSVFTVYYGTHRLYKSVNNGHTWEPISDDLTGGAPAAIRGIEVAPSNGQVIYVSTNDGRVLVSEDGGVNFDIKLTDVPGWPRVKREIAIDPIDDSTAYLAVGVFGVDQILKTTDRGDTWFAIDGNLPDVPVNTVTVDRIGDDRVIFLGTDRGVYIACGNEENWSKFGQGLPNVPVVDLEINIGFDRLVCATMGRGAWQVDLPNYSDPDMDGDIDLLDFWQLQNCFTGPADTPWFQSPSAECEQVFDFDRDSDIDAFDMSVFVSRMDSAG